jgi:hypothetical protein
MRVALGDAKAEERDHTGLRMHFACIRVEHRLRCRTSARRGPGRTAAQGMSAKARGEAKVRHHRVGAGCVPPAVASNTDTGPPALTRRRSGPLS